MGASAVAVLERDVMEEREEACLCLAWPRKESFAGQEEALETPNAVADMWRPPRRAAIAMHAMIAILAVKFLDKLRRGIRLCLGMI